MLTNFDLQAFIILYETVSIRSLSIIVCPFLDYGLVNSPYMGAKFNKECLVKYN